MIMKNAEVRISCIPDTSLYITHDLHKLLSKFDQPAFSNKMNWTQQYPKTEEIVVGFVNFLLPTSGNTCSHCLSTRHTGTQGSLYKLDNNFDKELVLNESLPYTKKLKKILSLYH